MSNAYHKAVGNRGLLDRLIGKLPGYKGYIDRDARQEADRIHREFVSKKIFAQKKAVQDVVEEVMSAGDLMGLEPLEKITNRIDKVAQKIRNASYGSASFFGGSAMGEEELQRLHSFDLGLVDAAEEIENEVAALAKVADDEAKRKAAIKTVLDVLNRVEEHFAGREEIIKK